MHCSSELIETLPRGAVCENRNVSSSWTLNTLYAASSLVESPCPFSSCVNRAGNCLDSSKRASGHFYRVTCTASVCCKQSTDFSSVFSELNIVASTFSSLSTSFPLMHKASSIKKWFLSVEEPDLPV